MHSRHTFNIDTNVYLTCSMFLYKCVRSIHIVDICTLYESHFAGTLTRNHNMKLRDMPMINVGIYADYTDFNTTAFCLTHGLDSQHKETCRNITGMWPTGAGAMLYYPVCKEYKTFVFKMTNLKHRVYAFIHWR
jgi:hypothetical protein